MRITMLDAVEDGLIATDDTDGLYLVLENGEVWHRGEGVEKLWFANNNVRDFRYCVAAYEEYCNTIVQTIDEDAVIASFEEALTRIGALVPRDEYSYWQTILEEIKAGLL